jgi:hypothetical protein
VTRPTPWTVELAMLADDGRVAISTCDLPDELSARQLVDLCRLIPHIRSAVARPLDKRDDRAA